MAIMAYRRMLSRPFIFLVLTLLLSVPAMYYGLMEGFPRTLGYGSTAACPSGNHWLFWNTFFLVFHISFAVYFLIKMNSESLCDPMKMIEPDAEDEEDDLDYAEARANVEGPTSDYKHAGTDLEKSFHQSLSPNLSDIQEEDDLSMVEDNRKPYQKPDVILYSVVTGAWVLWQFLGIYRAHELKTVWAGACDNIEKGISIILVCSLVYSVAAGFKILKMACQPHDDGLE